MKKFLNTLFGVLIVIGIVFTIGNASEAITAMNGKVVNLNEAVKSDFNKQAMIKGDIYYVYDQIAVEEVTHTSYGIKTGTDETYFYLIDNYNKDWFDSDSQDYMTIIYSTADKEKAKKLDEMAQAWIEYENACYELIESGNDNAEDFPDIPETTLELDGMIAEYNDDDLVKYRNEYLGEYITDDVDSFVSEHCTDMIIKDIKPSRSKGIFFAGIAITVIGIAGLVISIILGKKAKRNSEELL
ncbi:MAG: hypothetical protein PUB66_00960 [Oscillospiraceae bacterium]|nr:hypothetical protein [Ruminococcus sp.]MDD6097292.1 hypothetical protein [Oscillospiraceae bacterium]